MYGGSQDLRFSAGRTVTTVLLGCSRCHPGRGRPDSKEATMAFIARFSFDIPFGKKEEAFRVEAKFREFRDKLGFPKGEVLIGSIGAPESRVENNYRFESLAELEATFAKVGKEPRMAEFQREMAPFIVPGSHRWEIFRVRD